MIKGETAGVDMRLKRTENARESRNLHHLVHQFHGELLLAGTLRRLLSNKQATCVTREDGA
jgi:hypothetical protein